MGVPNWEVGYTTPPPGGGPRSSGEHVVALDPPTPKKNFTRALPLLPVLWLRTQADTLLTQCARPAAHTCIRAALYREMPLSLRVLSNFSLVESAVTQSVMNIFVATAEG
jgi:hypothetical protein